VILPDPAHFAYTWALCFNGPMDDQERMGDAPGATGSRSVAPPAPHPPSRPGSRGFWLLAVVAFPLGLVVATVGAGAAVAFVQPVLITPTMLLVVVGSVRRAPHVLERHPALATADPSVRHDRAVRAAAVGTAVAMVLGVLGLLWFVSAAGGALA